MNWLNSSLILVAALNLIGAATLGLALAFEPTEEDAMRRATPAVVTNALSAGLQRTRVLLDQLLSLARIREPCLDSIGSDLGLTITRTVIDAMGATIVEKALTRQEIGPNMTILSFLVIWSP